MIPHDIVDRVFNAARIEEVVADYVSLKKRGANLIGLCPFHDEKTGSFTVSPSKGIYKCFGCGKAGHTVGFIMEIEKCSFSEAIRFLAKRYHIDIPEREMTQEEKQQQDDRESMFVVNQFAHHWYQQQLWETEEGRAIGLSYLRERGLRDDIIRKFQLGYSPERAALWSEALKQGFDEKYLLNDSDHEPHIGTGICLKGSDGKLFDRFRGRVMFPFFSVSGKVVGFAGRLLKKNDKAGKYVNSPTSPIYEKHNELYGLHQAKQFISKTNMCYLVEGQVDVIQLVQSGIENVVASGGTSLTEQQVKLMHRFTENITILYDGDKAGIKAAIRGIDMVLEEGINVKVVLLPEGEDPDSFARSHNADQLLLFLQQNCVDFMRFKMNLLSEEVGQDPMKRVEMINSIVDSIAVIPDIIKRQIYIKDCSDTIGIQEDILTRKVIEVRKKKFAEKAKRTTPPATSPAEDPTTPTPAADVPPTPPSAPVLTACETNIINLLRVLVRYGEIPLRQLEDGSIQTTGEYIMQEFRDDEVSMPNTLYTRLLDEYQAHYRDENFKASSFFQHHEDLALSQLAIQLSTDQYQLSTLYNKQSISENVTRQVNAPTDADVLPELTQRLVLELKYTLVDERIEAMQNMLKEAQKQGDWELIRTILDQQPALMDVRQQLCRALGNRVITR